MPKDRTHNIVSPVLGCHINQCSAMQWLSLVSDTTPEISQILGSWLHPSSFPTSPLTLRVSRKKSEARVINLVVFGSKL